MEICVCWSVPCLFNVLKAWATQSVHGIPAESSTNRNHLISRRVEPDNFESKLEPNQEMHSVLLGCLAYDIRQRPTRTKTTARSGFFNRTANNAAHHSRIGRPWCIITDNLQIRSICNQTMHASEIKPWDETIVHCAVQTNRRQPDMLLDCC